MKVFVFLLLCLSIRLSVGGDSSLHCIGSERQALLEFKQSVTDPSNSLSSWFSKDCCSWDGLVCNNITKHVVELNLYAFEVALIGSEVSPALVELKHLEVLELGENDFRGSNIPDFFGSFKSLRKLYLSGASFAGDVPPSLGNLSNLQSLDLSGLEYLRVKSLTWVTHLSNLQKLDLSSVNLSQISDLPQVLNSFPSLLYLNLRGCQLVEFPLSLLSFKNLTSLLSLDLESNRFWTHVPDSLRNLTKLESLSLFGNGFNQQIPSFFSEFKNLRDLDLSSNSFSDSIPICLCKLSALQTFGLGNNQLSGSIPTCLGKLSNLIRLTLNSNRLNGTVPSTLGQLSNLKLLSLFNNSLSGVVSEIHFDKLSKLQYLDLSSNFLLLNVNSNWIPPFQLTLLDLGFCQLGSRFPLWLQSQKEIRVIGISNAGISGPYHIEDLLPHSPTELEYLDLSNNSISGPIPPNIGNMMPSLTAMVLSTNRITGGIPLSVCELKELQVIDLSNNGLVGDLPDNCWSGSKNMLIIDLASNNLTGTIPSGIGQLSLLNSLHLSNNKFYGELPIETKNCENLSVLDLAENGLTGKIPSWIARFSSLQILKLRSNKFEGSLNPELCQIFKLRILDLGRNHFSGIIPPCFANFDGMKQGGNMKILSSFRYNEKLMQLVKGRELEYTKSLKFLVNLDLSNNHLVGKIPEGLTFLVKLSSINLSNNRLIGGIPNMIGNLKSLQSLDFSQNRLSGAIPQSISDLGGIGYLNLSFNNLSGQIPFGHPQAFDSSSYAGNPQLCGIPLEKKCSNDKSPEIIDVNQNAERGSFEDGGFYIAMGTGVIVGFWGVFGVLIFKETWRHLFFQFIENMHYKFLYRIMHPKYFEAMFIVI